MTLTDYAKYLLSVCGKRFTHLYQRHYLDSTHALPSLSALLSYLKTQTASIYAYLQSRLQGDPTSGIPSITPTQPLTFANLLPNLQKLATRKIDAGASTQIPDGISLVRLLCDTTAASAVTELIDTNNEYTMDKQMVNICPSATKLTLGCKKTENITPFSNGVLEEIVFDKLEESHLRFIFSGLSALRKLSFPKMTKYDTTSTYGSYSFITNCTNLVEVSMPMLSYIHHWNINTGSWTDYFLGNNPNLEKVIFGTLTNITGSSGTSNPHIIRDCPKLLHLEIGVGTAINLYFNSWSPTLTDTNRATFLTNFRQYLFLRLADRTATTALTLTLSSAVYTALTTETSTLAELGITTLTDKEQAAGITLETSYNTWLDTYRAAINWNITNAG